MKRGFSIGEAVAEPFRLAFRSPVATMAWGLVMLLPAVAVLAGVGQMVGVAAASSEIGGLESGEAPFDVQQMMAFQAWSWLGQVLGLLAMLLVTTAVIRAVLAGRRRDGAAFLRLGKTEFNVAVIGLSIGVCAGIVAIFAAVVAVALGFFLGANAGQATGWTAGLLVLAALLCGLLVWGRLSLIAPTAVMRGDLAFAEGWRAGRGQTFRLFLLILALFAVTLLLGVLIVIVCVALALALGGGLAHWGDEAAMEAWLTAHMDDLIALWWVGLVLLPPLAWLQGLSQALWTAPFAVAARDLAPPSIGADAAPHAG